MTGNNWERDAQFTEVYDLRNVGAFRVIRLQTVKVRSEIKRGIEVGADFPTQ